MIHLQPSTQHLVFAKEFFLLAFETHAVIIKKLP